MFEGCVPNPVDCAYVEELLQRGANPLGKILDGAYYNNLYAAVADRLILHGENGSESLYKITELFIRYGMKIDEPEIPYDNDDFLHPLWYFGFPLGPVALRTLKLFLDNGLDAESAAEAWGHQVSDFIHVCGELKDEDSYQMFYDSLKKLLLIAFYPHILDADEDLQKFIWLSQNQYDPLNFRNYDDFAFEIDTSRCPKSYPEAYRSVVTVKEIKSGEVVWKMGFGISPHEI